MRGPGFLARIPRRPAIAATTVVVVAFALGRLTGGDHTVVPPTTPTGEAHEHAHKTTENHTVWTCSMHPQIRMSHPGKCPICGMTLIPLETNGKDEGPRSVTLSATARKLARIETSPVRRDFASRKVRMYGTITYDETRVSYITAWVPGRLDRLYADFTGMTVKKGDHMVYMYSPQLLSAQQELLQARAAVTSLDRSNSASLRNTAESTLRSAREKLRLYGLTRKQIAKIESSGRPSDHLTIYSPIGGVVVHKNSLEGMYVKTGERIYTVADLRHLWVILDAYESDLPWLAYGQKLQFTSRSFPGTRFKGFITFIDPIVNKKTRTVRVRALVDNIDGRLKPNMFVRGIVQSRIDADGHVLNQALSGKFICPMHPEVIRDTPGTCDICGMKLEPAKKLGYVIDLPKHPVAPLLIPASSVLLTGKRAVVYVQREDSTDGAVSYDGREIELGPRAGNDYVVRSGLAEGELVVTSGAFKLDSELQIQAKPSMMSPEDGARPAQHHGAGATPSVPGASPASGPPHNASSGSAAAHSATSPGGTAVARKALEPVWTAYFSLHGALASDDARAASKAAVTLQAALKAVDTSLFSDADRATWKTLAERITKTSSAISSAPDLKRARAAFADLSATVIETETAFGHTGGNTYYALFCPMARKGKGAWWVQLRHDTRNPYLGQSMPSCGTVKQTYKSIR